MDRRMGLFAAGIWPFHWHRQARALRVLLRASDPEAVDILVAAVDAGHRLSPRIRAGLAGCVSPAQTDRLWHLWSERRAAWLADLLGTRGTPARTPHLAALSLLKLRRADALSTEALTLDQVLPHLADADADVRETGEAYLRRVGLAAPHLFLAALLVLNRFGDIGSSRAAVRGVLSLELDAAELQRLRGLYLAQLPRAEQLCAALLTDPTGLPRTRKQAWELLPFFADPDEDVRAGAEAYRTALHEQVQAVGMRLDLKLGRSEALPTGHLAAPSVLNALTDADPDVRAGVSAYAARLACDEAMNEMVFAAWSRTGDEDLAAVIRAQRRIPAGAAKSTVFNAAGDEDALVAACRPLGIADLLELTVRWTATGRRPGDPARLRVVEEAVAALQTIGPLTFEPPVALPAGLTDFFDWWEGQPRGDEALRESRGSADPLARAGAAWVSHLYGALPQAELDRLADSADWPDRLVSRMIGGERAQPAPDHVQHTQAVAGTVDPDLLAATAAGTAASRDRLVRLRDTCAGRTDRTAGVNGGLANLLLAFQNYFVA